MVVEDIDFSKSISKKVKLTQPHQTLVHGSLIPFATVITVARIALVNVENNQVKNVAADVFNQNSKFKI